MWNIRYNHSDRFVRILDMTTVDIFRHRRSPSPFRGQFILHKHTVVKEVLASRLLQDDLFRLTLLPGHTLKFYQCGKCRLKKKMHQVTAEFLSIWQKSTNGSKNIMALNQKSTLQSVKGRI